MKMINPLDVSFSFKMAENEESNFFALEEDDDYIPPSQPPNAQFLLTQIRAEPRGSEDSDYSGDDACFGEYQDF